MCLTKTQLIKLKTTAQTIKPTIQIGREGLTPGQLDRINQELAHRELVKIRFNHHKDQKTRISQEITAKTQATQVDLIGNTLVLYRQSPDPEKRKHLI